MGQYSHKHFFRQTPNALLERYFDIKPVNLGVDYSTLHENDSETLFQAFTALPDDIKTEIEADFQDVNSLASDGGVAALIDESTYHTDESTRHTHECFIKEIAAINSFHGKVMWAYCKNPTYWRIATMLLHADNISFLSWKKRNNLPKIPPHVEDHDIKELENAISAYFYTKEARGKNCQVEPYRRNDKEYFFAYPEDFAQSNAEWINNKLKSRAHHPAFEIIFVYCQHEGSLDIYAPRNAKAVPELQALFAKTILKTKILKDSKIDKRVYTLEPMAEAGFEFNITPELGIKSVIVTRLRLTLKTGSKRRITLEADTKKNHNAVYALLDELNPPSHYITQVGIKVIFDPENGKKSKTRSFNISYPNSCALNHDRKDLLIRQMLAQSGIEPQLNADNEQ